MDHFSRRIVESGESSVRPHVVLEARTK